MQVDLKAKGWVNEDKNAKLNSDFFVGTIIQSLGDLKGYIVNIMFHGIAIPSKKVMTYEEADKIENDIWDTIQGGSL